jgi:hypothetical protein
MMLVIGMLTLEWGQIQGCHTGHPEAYGRAGERACPLHWAQTGRIGHILWIFFKNTSNILEYTWIYSIFPCRAGAEVLWARWAHRQPWISLPWRGSTKDTIQLSMSYLGEDTKDNTYYVCYGSWFSNTITNILSIYNNHMDQKLFFKSLYTIDQELWPRQFIHCDWRRRAGRSNVTLY